MILNLFRKDRYKLPDLNIPLKSEFIKLLSLCSLFHSSCSFYTVLYVLFKQLFCPVQTVLYTSTHKSFFMFVPSKTTFCLLFLMQSMLLFVGCLTSQQHASVSQGRICSDNFTCCHTEIEVADQTFHITQSQYTDMGQPVPALTL